MSWVNQAVLVSCSVAVGPILCAAIQCEGAQLQYYRYYSYYHHSLTGTCHILSKQSSALLICEDYLINSPTGSQTC